MRYGSIGWSVGSTLGYAFASGTKSRVKSEAVPNGLDSPETSKRVLSLIGDGSFQMTAQDVSTMLRYSLTPIIILVRGRCSVGDRGNIYSGAISSQMAESGNTWRPLTAPFVWNSLFCLFR